MAIEEINEAGGVHGRQLKLEWFDEAYEVATAQRLIRRLLSDVKPFMIYSGTGSTVFVSVHEMLRESGIPVYNGFSGSYLVRQDPEAPNMFHGHAVSAEWVQKGMLDLVQDLEAERVAVMHEVGEWGRSVCEPTIDLLKEVGVEPTTVETYTTGDTDFSGQLVSIRRTNPQVVVNCGLFPEAAVILQQARELGLQSIFIGDTAQANQSVWSRAGSAADNFIFNWYSPYFLTDEAGPMAEFRERYMERYPSAPEGRPAHSDTFAYGDARVIAEALERAGENPTHESFNEAMKTIVDFQTAPFNAHANFDNSRNDGFSVISFMRVIDGTPVNVDEQQLAELKEIVAGL
jgi:branched-chain amino acid transport system substrate-binding protein